ncbi:Chromosome partition protein smc [Castellaniella defragrans 65Phen]|uniref:Chromosome partition protein smc n=2 Tax=Castellaniella defragrans TaxID=75697 RepID=W8X579_CASD6|nr:Chromosome partition protein smc [Castellaniella defragrans 65Phen]
MGNPHYRSTHAQRLAEKIEGPDNEDMEPRLQALETAMISTNEQFGGIRVRLDKVEERLDKVEKRLDRIEERLDRVEERLDKIEERLDKVEHRLQKVEEHLIRHSVLLEHTATRADILEALNTQTKWVIGAGFGLMTLGVAVSKLF